MRPKVRHYNLKSESRQRVRNPHNIPSRAHLCDIEKGRRSVSAKRAAQFARTLGYPSWIFLQTALEDQVREAGLRFKVTVRAA